MRIEAGLIRNISYHLSPHHNERPDERDISLAVVHNISLPPGQFTGDAVQQFFLNKLNFDAHPYYQTIKDLTVSAHLLIRRDGRLIQFVPFHLRAWHAGVSEFQGRADCNDFSIGIELEGCDDLPFESSQYQSLANVLRLLIEHYPKMTKERVVGHSDIAPGRKTDPGPAFDWNYLTQLISGELCT